MKIILLNLCLLFLINDNSHGKVYISYGKTYSSYGKTAEANFVQTFTGTLNGKTDVSFQLSNVNGQVTGFYLYDRIGIDISLSGTISGEDIELYELDYLQNKTAKISGKLTKEGFKGKWESLSTKKTFPVLLVKTNKKIPSLPKTLLGRYKFSAEISCKLDLYIYKDKGVYLYTLKTDKHSYKGKVTFTRSLDEQANYIYLQGIQWAENEGDISREDPEDNSQPESLELPNFIDGLIGINEITIQNSGNAMNSYTKLAECTEVKYIQLTKK